MPERIVTNGQLWVDFKSTKMTTALIFLGTWDLIKSFFIIIIIFKSDPNTNMAKSCTHILRNWNKQIWVEKNNL